MIWSLGGIIATGASLFLGPLHVQSYTYILTQTYKHIHIYFYDILCIYYNSWVQSANLWFQSNTQGPF